MAATNSNTKTVQEFIDEVLHNKPEDKRRAWAKVFSDEEFDTVSDLMVASTASWDALHLPLAVKDALKAAICDLKSPAASAATPTPTPITTAPPTPTAVATPAPLCLAPITPSVSTPAKNLPISAPATRNDTRPLTQIEMVVFDISSSMNSSSFDPTPPPKTRLELAKTFFHTMVDKLSALELAHALGLVTFGERVSVTEFTREYERFQDTLGNAEANENATKLYDAIMTGAKKILAYAQKNRANLATGDDECKLRLFCLTDGEDNASTTPYWRVAQFLQQNHIILDAFPLASMNKNLQQMTEATGGLCLKVVDVERGVGLFEREAVLHVNSREKPTSTPTPITGEKSMSAFTASAAKLVEDVKAAVPQAVFKPVATHQDIQQQAASTSTSAPTKRLLTEYERLQRTPSPLWRYYMTADNLSFWKVIMEGPPGTDYAGGFWLLSFTFPPDYPFRAPTVKFVTPIYHINITNDGKICLDIIMSGWGPNVTVATVCQQITELLETPNTADPLDPVKAYLYKDNRAQYKLETRAHTAAHAASSLEDLKRQYAIASDPTTPTPTPSTTTAPPSSTPSKS
ncbi:Ubiquitin-conjugating enzyme [Pelomyxa schiedti]|nr:Ubiquitin-conjugating enzyme [Pelomyxa schiedti]